MAAVLALGLGLTVGVGCSPKPAPPEPEAAGAAEAAEAQAATGTATSPTASAPAAEAAPVQEQPPKERFSEDFSEQTLGELPEGWLALDGEFAVTEVDGDRFLRLPGEPIRDMGAVFGPFVGVGYEVQARIRAVARGRRLPRFGIGLGGAGAYALRVAPAQKALELYQADAKVAEAPFAWTRDAWTQVKLRLTHPGDGVWRIQAKAWAADTPEPADWTLTWDDPNEPFDGQALILGSPYSSEPIDYDDLKVLPVP